MSTETTHPTQKELEYQEAGHALRAAERGRRTAITFFGVSTVGLLGFIYGRKVPADTCAYLSMAGILLSVTSYFLFRGYTYTIEYTKELLLKIQVETGARVYPSFAQRRQGLSEKNFYRFIYALVGIVFVATAFYYVSDAYERRHLLFQSCSPYADAAGDRDACPCGDYPDEALGACQIPGTDSTEEKNACEVIPFAKEWTVCPIKSSTPTGTQLKKSTPTGTQLKKSTPTAPGIKDSPLSTP